MHSRRGSASMTPIAALTASRHVHHVEAGVRLEETGVAPMRMACVEDLDRVVGRAAAGLRHVGDQPGKRTPRVSTPNRR